MFRVYNQSFYENPSKKKKFEHGYIELLKKKAIGTNVKESGQSVTVNTLYSLCNQKLTNLVLKYGGSIPELPEDFDDLLILSPRKMAKIYIEFNKNINFHEDIVKSFSSVWRKARNRNGKEFYERKFLDYDFFSADIAEYLMNNENSDLYTINTCFYCNRTYINNYIEYTTGRKKKQFDLDHFIPKSECPLFALSLYNLVPSCQVCNSRIKLSKVYYSEITKTDDLEKLFPTSENYDFDNSLKFRILPCKKIYDSERQFVEFKEIPDSFRIEFEQKNNDNPYMKEAESFDIIQRYEYHKKEFLAYIDKARKYPASYFLMFAQKNSVSDMKDLHEAIFDTKLRNEQKMVFQKIYNDIDKEL